MKYWEWFWTASLLISGAAFAVITAIVIVKGGPDLREMLRQLKRQNPGASGPPESGTASE